MLVILNTVLCDKSKSNKEFEIKQICLVGGVEKIGKENPFKSVFWKLYLPNPFFRKLIFTPLIPFMKTVSLIMDPDHKTGTRYKQKGLVKIIE